MEWGVSQREKSASAATYIEVIAIFCQREREEFLFALITFFFEECG